MSSSSTGIEKNARLPGRCISRALLLLLTVLPGCAAVGTPEPPAAASYYISAAGSDSGRGTSRGEAWRTFSPLEAAAIPPGTQILLESGGVFAGPLHLQAENCQGTVERPIVIESSGQPPATIAAGQGTAIELQDCQGVEIRNIRLIGAGIARNEGHGLHATTLRTAEAPLVASGLEVTGFRKGGITIYGPNGRKGFHGLRLLDNHVHHNGSHGIMVGGQFDSALPGYNHRDVLIRGNRVDHNFGDPSNTSSHTGSGIVIGQVAGALIEHNLAFENGGWNSYPRGGPVGIWAWDSTAVTIQFNESHHNRSGTIDGGGFDLDGGVSHSLVQFNYAHDNHGPGYLFAQFEPSRPMQSNILRFNLSVGDAALPGHGALQIWTAGESLEDLRITNNTVIGKGLMLRANGPLERSSIERNIFQSKGGGPLVLLEEKTEHLLLLDNAYLSAGGTAIFRDRGRDFPTLEAWREATDRERSAGRPLGRMEEGTSQAAGTGAEAPAALTGYGLCPEDARFAAAPPLWRQGRLEWPCPSVKAGLASF